MDDGKEGYDPSPVNPVPGIVWALFAVIFGVEAVLAGAESGLWGGADGIGWRLALIGDYGFSPQYFAWMRDTGQFPTELLIRFVSYPFLHYGFVHMILACVFLLAMGKMVGETIGQVAVAVIFFGSSVLGAALYGLLNEDTWLVGAYPGAYGLIGGFTFLLWSRAKITGTSQARAFSLIAMLMGVQLAFGLLFGTDNTWVADLGGFVAGFGLSFFFIPGALAAVLLRMRQR